MINRYIEAYGPEVEDRLLVCIQGRAPDTEITVLSYSTPEDKQVDNLLGDGLLAEAEETEFELSEELNAENIKIIHKKGKSIVTFEYDDIQYKTYPFQMS